MNIEYIENKIAVITLSHNSVNSINLMMLKDLDEALDDIENSSSSVLIINSSSKHFCAGADLKERKAFSNKQTLEFLNKINNLNNRIFNLGLITISSINGACLGGGLEIALSTDFRIASDDAILGFPEASIGIIPGAGGTQRLTNLCGQQTAMRWIFTAEKFTAHDALKDSVVDFVAPYTDLDSFALKFATSITKNAPIALKAAKKSIKSTLVSRGLNMEREQYLVTLISKDRNEGLLSFAQNRSPKWKNK